MRLLLLLALLQASSTWAAPVATVEGMRVPVWVERQGAPVPLTAEMELHAGDRVRTGPGGRILLQLREGSEVRLGSETTFELLKLEAPTTPGGAFTGLLHVVRGALRYTTSLLSKSFRRDLDIRIGTVNAGISGTDVWTKAALDRDIICVIEGQVTVTREDAEPLVLNQPLTFYVAPKDSEPDPVASVDAEQLDRWINLVALERGTGIITDGPWAVVLGSFQEEDRAARALEALHQAGIPARKVPVTLKGTRWLRLSVTGFRDRAEAADFIRHARGLTDTHGAWAYRP